jgi:hypothetical protein
LRGENSCKNAKNFERAHVLALNVMKPAENCIKEDFPNIQRISKNSGKKASRENIHANKDISIKEIFNKKWKHL